MNSKKSCKSDPLDRNPWQPVLLDMPRLPLEGLVLSILGHAWLLLLLNLLPVGSRSRFSQIDLDTEKVTYYRISGEFPNVSPHRVEKQPPESASQPPAPLRPDALVKERDVQIHPEIPNPIQQIIEQPEVPQVTNLPRLELPNILFQPLKSNRGVEAPVPLPEISADLRQEKNLPRLELPDQLLNRLKTSRGIEPAVALPDVSGDFQHGFKRDTSIPAESTVNPKIASPPPLPQSALQLGDLGSGTEVKDLSAVRKTPLLAYSQDPVLPKGELAVPKVRTAGSLSASSSAGTASAVPAGSLDFGAADITIPNVSIKTPVVIPSVAAEGLTIQAPGLPPSGGERPRELEKQPRKLLQDYLPTKSEPLKLPLGPSAVLVPDSPLLEAERKGLVIYMAAINAPNFTSKRGSWIFRFAELLDPGPATPSPSPKPVDHRPQLTAPSAVVKVDPRYPPEVIRDRIEGLVILYAVIRHDGVVDPQSVRILQKLDPRLDVSARDALLAWKFRPSTKDGEPIDIQAEVSIPFYLHRDIFSP